VQTPEAEGKNGSAEQSKNYAGAPPSEDSKKRTHAQYTHISAHSRNSTRSRPVLLNLPQPNRAGQRKDGPELTAKYAEYAEYAEGKWQKDFLAKEKRRGMGLVNKWLGGFTTRQERETVEGEFSLKGRYLVVMEPIEFEHAQQFDQVIRLRRFVQI